MFGVRRCAVAAGRASKHGTAHAQSGKLCPDYYMHWVLRGGGRPARRPMPASDTGCPGAANEAGCRKNVQRARRRVLARAGAAGLFLITN
jgi:hypothetical protein